MKNLLRVIKYTKPFWRYTALIGLMLIFTLAQKQISPWIYKIVTDSIVSNVGENIDGINSMKPVLPWLFGLLGLYIVGAVTSRIRERSSNWLEIKMRAHLTRQAFAHLMNMHVNFFDEETSGSVMSKLDRGVSRIVGISYSLSNHFLPNVLSGIISITVILFIRWEIAVFLLSTMIPYIVINSWVLNKHKKLEKVINKMYDEQYSHFYEVLSSMRLVKGFSKEDYENDKLKEFFDEISNIEVKFQRMWDIASSKDIILTILNWCVYLYVIWLTFSGELTIGMFFLLYQYISLVQTPVFQLTWMFFDIKRSMNGAEDYLKLMDAKPTIVDREDSTNLIVEKGEIEFKNVTFRYKESKEIFKNFNLKINPGETVAFVGKSGVGKTTIANLLTRMHDPQKGQILIDGTDIRDVKQKSLRQQIGAVMQESYLYGLTVKDNLYYGNEDLSEEKMIAACKAANAHEFIKDLPKRYDTKLGERGVKLSGGQKQRVSIARTILKNPPILILDEATSALDSESEAKVQEAIWRLIADRTTMIIAHRLSTIQKADRIVVLGAKGIMEQGSHEELLKHKGTYARLHELQSGKTKEKLLEEYELL